MPSILVMANVPPGAPYLTQPLENQTAIMGTTVEFSVAVIGAPPLSYQWRFNGTNLPGATDAILTLTNLQPAQAGAYSVQVSNAVGTVVSSNAVLTLLPLVLAARPQSQMSYLWGAASFFVCVNSGAPVAYQWRFNGADLPDATSATLALTNVQLNQAGRYTVVVSNVFAVTNLEADLVVNLLATWGLNYSGLMQVPLGLTNTLQIAAGGDHSQALRTDQTIAIWGDKCCGQTNVPTDLAAFVAVAAGYAHSLALRFDGTVVAWGYNSSGQTNVPPGLANVVAIAGGDEHSLALKANGTVTAWGDNFYGQTNVPAGLSNVVAIVGGYGRSLALRADGTLVAWGDNHFGQTNIPAALTNVVAISAGGYHNLALSADGTLTAWGWNRFGQTNVPSGLTNVLGIAAGGQHSMALKLDGTVVSWGDNSSGQTNTLAGLTNVQAIAAGDAHSLALIGFGPPSFAVSLCNPALGGGGFQVSVSTRSGRVYRLEYKTSFADSTWTAFPLIAGNGATQILTDPTVSGTQRFYRVRQW